MTGFVTGCQPCTFFLALCWAVVIFTCSACDLLQTVYGEVGAENYTYYRISRAGRLALKLASTNGDADIYVSDKTLKPTFSDYEAQSVTCGLDTVEIPASFSRPVGVAVYGCQSCELSHYQLEIFLRAEEVITTYESLDEDPYKQYNDQSESTYDTYDTDSYNRLLTAKHVQKDGDVDDAPWWTLLVDILKIIFEVII